VVRVATKTEGLSNNGECIYVWWNNKVPKMGIMDKGINRNQKRNDGGDGIIGISIRAVKQKGNGRGMIGETMGFGECLLMYVFMVSRPGLHCSRI
jgi:hypothetical protein